MEIRKPEYLSPSALSTWRRSPEEYFLKYLAPNRPPRDLQTRPMAVGSAFDAYVKSAIAKDFGIKEKSLEFDRLFAQQVEEQNREFGLQAGKICFDQYVDSQAYASLMHFLAKCDHPPRMEFTERMKSTVGGVELLGKPDLYVEYHGMRVIPDWKVNGYCSATPKSPDRGYVKLFDIHGKKHNATHDDAYVEFFKDLEHDGACNLQKVQPDWTRQLCTYNWVCGGAVGSPFIGWIEQLAVGREAQVRVARHVQQIEKDFQLELFAEYEALWSTIQDGHIFKELSKEESDARCKILNQQAQAYEVTDINDAWYNQMMGKK